jgi:hypothetical protein
MRKEKLRGCILRSAAEYQDLAARRWPGREGAGGTNLGLHPGLIRSIRVSSAAVRRGRHLIMTKGHISFSLPRR